MVELDESLWHYFLMLEYDFNNTLRYVDLTDKTENNDKTFSIEFARQIVCIGSEFDTVATKLCKLIEPNREAGEIAHYKEIILSRYPEIYNAPVYIDRYKRKIYPFRAWRKAGKKLKWWKAYNQVKHQRDNYFAKANLKNTLDALSSLLLIELYFYGTADPVCNKRKLEAILLRAPGMMELYAVQPEEDLPGLPRILPDRGQGG